MKLKSRGSKSHSYKKWYQLPDVLRTDYYQAIIQIYNELCVVKEIFVYNKNAMLE